MTLWLIPLVVLGVLVALEFVFRGLHQLRHHRPYHISLKPPWRRGHVVPHPFLSFAYRRGGIIDYNQPLPYDLHPNRFFSFKEPLRLNNFGHFGADFSLDKPTDVFRVACLGASTTANSISDGERDYSYPKLLKERLTQIFAERGYSKRVEVYNCGIGGWVSADILINFELNILHTKPDYVVLYHGFNDLPLYLTEDFALDYSHGRANLGEVIYRIKRAYYLPKIRFWHSYEWSKDKLFGTGNVRNDVLRMIATAPARTSREFHDLRTEQSILRNIAVLCRHYRIRCVLSSFAYFLYSDGPIAAKYAEGVAMENALMRELAEEFSLPFVDQASLIPAERDYFVDAVHFTPAGMACLAENFCAAISADVEARLGQPNALATDGTG